MAPNREVLVQAVQSWNPYLGIKTREDQEMLIALTMATEHAKKTESVAEEIAEIAILNYQRFLPSARKARKIIQGIDD